MGTVPDSLRSAKVSLITASSKENVLGELRLAHASTSPAQVREHVNGLPSAPEEAALSPRAAAVALMQACEHEPTQPGMSSAILHEVEKASPTLSSPASPQLPAGGESPALSPCCRPQRDPLRPEHTMPAADQHISRPSTGDKPLAPTGPEVTPLRAQRTSDAETHEEPQYPVGDSGDSSKEQVCHDFPARETSQELVQVTETPASPADLGPVYCATGGSQEKQTQATSEPQSGSCDPTSRGHGCLASTMPSGVPSPQVPTHETPETSNLAGSSTFCPEPAPVPRAATLPGSRFKEASTMTSPMGSEVVARPSRAQRDAEVQAVASVESRSVCTSPGILPAFLREVPASDCFEPQEELRVVCHSGAGRKNTLELSNREQAAQGSGPGREALPGMPTQADAAASAALQEEGKQASLPGEMLQTSRRQGSPSGAQDAGREDGELPGMSAETLISQPLAGGGDRSLAQGSKSASRPAEFRQVDRMPGERAEETTNDHKTDPGGSLSDSGGPTSKGDQRGLLEPTGKEKPAAPGRETPEESAGPSSLAGTTGPEAQSLLLHPKSQEGGGPASAANPSPLRKHQEGPTEENRAAKSAASLSLPPDCSGESSPGSGKRTPGRTVRASPRRASRVSEFLREQKLNVTAAVGLAPGERKKQQDAKLHVKQSKRVRDVVWDEQGMTWEVYGASLDPESLGVAIQNHLQRQIREHEKLIKAQSRRSVSSDTSSHKKLKGRQHSVLQSMLQNFRRPNCCVRPAPSSVLD